MTSRARSTPREASEGPRVSFHDHIAHNRRMTVLVLAFMFGLMFTIVFAVGYLWGVPPYATGILALVITSIYLLVTYNFSVEAVLAATNARPANPQNREEKLLMYRVEEMALAAGLPVPKVYVQDSRDINAFATGLTPEEGVVCVTTGAMEQLTQEELEGVIAHEMAHILNRDIRLTTITVAVVGAIAMLGEIAIRMLWFGGGNRDRQGNGLLLVVAIVLIILAPIFSRLAYLFLSRRREYLADATGAKLTRNPEGLAGALDKIKRDVPDDPVGSKTVAGLYFANPWTRKSRGSVWSTHPPLDERIRRLRGM